MATIFEEMAPVALELIGELNVDVVVQEHAVSANASAGTSSITKTPRACKAATRDFEETFESDARGGVASRRRVVEGLVIIPASYVPNGIEPGWSIFLAAITTDPATEYKVVSAERVPKVGTAIVWKAKVRR